MDRLSKPKKKGKVPLLKRKFPKNGDFEGKYFAPILNRGPINSGESGPSSPVKLGQKVSLYGMSLGGSDLRPLIDEEFLINVLGINFKEVVV